MSSNAIAIIERTIEYATGSSITYFRDTPLSIQREAAERAHGKPTSVSCLPSERGYFLTSEQVNQLVDKALRA